MGASMPGKTIRGGVHCVDMHARKSADGREMLAPRRIFALKKRGKRVVLVLKCTYLNTQ